MLTNASAKAGRRRSCAYKLAYGEGLYFHVAPTGTKSFRMRYRDRHTREQTLTFGEISLNEARTLRGPAKAQIDRGEYPRGRSKLSFEAAARV